MAFRQAGQGGELCEAGLCQEDKQLYNYIDFLV